MKALVMNNKILTAILVVLLVIAIFVSLGSRKAENETITLAPKEFVKQVSVSGKVVAERAVDLAFDQGGRVSAIYAKVGDHVASGKILASVENGDAYANVLQKEANLEAAQARLETLTKGTRPESLSIARQEVLGKQSDLTQKTKALSDAIKSSYGEGDDALRRYSDELFTNPRTSNAKFNYQVDANLKSEIETERFDLEGMLVSWNLQISGTITESKAEQFADDAIANLQAIRNFLDKMSIAVNSILASSNLSQSTLDGFKADIALARTNVNSAISNITSAETQYKSAQTSLKTSEDNLALLVAGSTPEEIKTQEAVVKSEQASLASAQAQYRKTLITAPFSGLVTKMDIEVGGQASISNPQISMISNGNFIIEGYIPEINISSVMVGNKAVVNLDAYGEDVLFDAKVTSVDPAETIKDGVSTYKIELEFLVNDSRIRSGMTANVLITTLEKSDVISVPQGLVVKEDGQSYVYKLESGKSVKQKVTTGEVSSSGSIEILSGLESGDVVVAKTDSN